MEVATEWLKKVKCCHNSMEDTRTHIIWPYWNWQILDICIHSGELEALIICVCVRGSRHRPPSLFTCSFEAAALLSLELSSPRLDGSRPLGPPPHSSPLTVGLCHLQEHLASRLGTVIWVPLLPYYRASTLNHSTALQAQLCSYTHVS